MFTGKKKKKAVPVTLVLQVGSGVNAVVFSRCAGRCLEMIGKECSRQPGGWGRPGYRSVYQEYPLSATVGTSALCAWAPSYSTACRLLQALSTPLLTHGAGWGAS